MIGHTGVGIFGSVGGISEGLSKCTSSLAFDDYYIKKLQDEERNKPKTILDGVKRGLYQPLYGVYSGAKGVFTKPYQGCRESGFFVEPFKVG